MQDLNDYFSSVSTKSNFQCDLGELGGFINFTNSGQRGLKEFTISLKSILTGLQDIVDNINAFENHSTYVEKSWRDLGSKYFTDLVLQSMITVQTKPCFTTFSKVISWANDIDPSEHDDNLIDLRVSSLNNAIAKIKNLSQRFTPINARQLSPKSQTNQNTTIISESGIGLFAYKLIEFLTKNNIELPLFENLLEKNPDSRNYNIELNGYRLTSIFRASHHPLSEDDLKRANKVRFFTTPFKVNSDLYYLSNQWTDGTDSRLDIQTLITIFNELYDDYKIFKENENYVLIQTSQKEQKSLPDNVTTLSKPFLLLAGISGTGKTRFVREQAKATGSISDTYCLTSVRPDWHEPSDILGYTSRLGGDGNANYITTDVLQFIAKAWRAIIDSGLELEPEGNGLAVIGNKNELNQVLPYWLCLDEMNLAPVEQYFADYLSVLETREWQWDDEHFTYCCDSLLKSETIKQLGDKSKLREALGFTGEQYDDAWNLFCEHGLGLPFNLIVAGTVNMDETTHGFSRKVIDRALSFDFGDFFPNEFDNFFEPKVTHNALSYPIDSQASIDKLPPIDRDGSKSISFLKSINKVLDDTPFQLAFRALNELLLAVISAYPEGEKQLQAVWDDFLMCKVLPRIEGDHDKLAVISDSVSSHEESLLTELTAILKQELIDIWSIEDDPDKLRPDLYRKNIDGSFLYIACRSKAKLTWMQQRLERSGFTSFWP
ncbi:McrB family protein [Psychrobacter celer]